ncbi:hypothetical protein B5X24_HaOG213178 [Helicoverpa armigera]|uniref:Major facilitator superfamily (MFS) profile domain-containing protein n=1 Tax=Helicoverpa armigera TaxID=29058 RepID=A0A2W1BCH7_HELAM|nr:hypothetical protein B5X24_HaOG213178 [Helicoverpa armigera]
MKFKINNVFTVEENKNKDKDKEAKPNFDDDYVVKSMGAFGRWQAIVCTVISMSRLIAMWNILSILFLTPATKFICKKFKDDTEVVVENSTCYANCLEYEFDHDVFEETIISNFGLICDKAWLASLTQMILMLGLVIGVASFGWVSDRYGRRKAIILSAAIDLIFMIASAFAPTYWTFTALRFFVGVASGGIMSITAVFTLETVGPQHREVAGTLALLPDSIAEASLALFAYLATTWRVYLLEIGGLSSGILLLLLFLPETPRWLMAKGKADAVVELMTKAAKFNKRSTSNIKENVEKSLKELNLKENEAQTMNYSDLFKTKQLAMITMSSVAIWFVTGLCYYGINQYITVLGSNVFIVVAVTGVIQIPTAPLATVITKVYGRKASTICSYMMIGVSMVILIFLPNGTWVSTIFGMIGVMCSCLNFCVIYLYVIELYPTAIRNMGFSLSSSGSKLGAMVAPFLASIQPRWIASLIFAILPFIAAAICLLLPETKGRKLRDTVDE